MGRRWRRGNLSVIDTLIQVVIIGAFLAFIWLFLVNNLDSTAFFNKFHSMDIAASSDAVNAGNGDVILRYDSFKEDKEHTLWLNTEGKTAVGSTNDENKELDAIVYFYGKPMAYRGLTLIRNPTSIVMRKIQGTFAITEAETVLEHCPYVTPRTPMADASVHIIVEGFPIPDDNKKVETAFREKWKSKVKEFSDQNPDIKIHIIKEDGTSNKIQITPTSTDGQSFACFFVEKLKETSLIDFASNTPGRSGVDFDVRITVTTDQSVKPLSTVKLNEALDRAFARYYLWS